MSDNHHHVQLSLGEIDHTQQLSKHFGELYLSPDYSDVTLIIEGISIPGHKIILAARSEYFRALFYNGMKESTMSEIELKSTSLISFKHILKYLYTGQISLTSLKEEVVIEILGLTHVYGFSDLENSISEFLTKTLTTKNVCSVFDAANMYGFSSLADVCFTFIDRHAVEIIHSESFYSISAAALKEMITRDSFCAQEIDIFKAVCGWCERNPGANSQDIIMCVRLSLISLQDLLNIVRPSGLVSADSILDAIKARAETKDTDLHYRGYLMPEENVASLRHSALVLKGDMRSAVLDGDVSSYDIEKGFTRHHIDQPDNSGHGILIKLGMQCIVNHIRMLLWDRDTRAYSYYLEVSVDLRDWVRVIDHTQYLCRSWQYLYFPARVVKYIRLVGTHNTVNRFFHVVSLECMFTNKPFSIHNGILVPKHNVASISASACVIEGVSRSRNALINGDWLNYDWDTGYTCHQLGSGAIIVQLSQPFILDSMRLLLWDIDQRTYSYYIEVSTDQENWSIVADKRGESCRSWQIIAFPKRPVVFIRIVGTYNTANEVFHCVHFECPTQVIEPLNEKVNIDSTNVKEETSSEVTEVKPLNEQEI